jgi:UDP-2,3-diacylglucosamine hydrolase
MDTDQKKIYFISDVHLGTSNNETEQIKQRKLRSFFEHIQKDAKALYILGDYFDFWFEYRHAIPKACVPGVHLLMRLAERGIAIHYLSGNHDHWVHDFFERNIGITHYSGACALEIKGKKIYLYHGDGASALDKNYRIMKKILRNKISIFLYRWLHPDIGIPLGNRMSHVSKDQDRDYQKYVNDRSIEPFLKKIFDDGTDIIIMGHHHQPKEEMFGDKKYINLGDWITHFTYAEFVNDTVILKKWTEHEI